MRGWTIERRYGPASTFHARALGDQVVRTVAVLEVDRPALVLGSTQGETDADADALTEAGVELVRRRSGGGAVLLAPGRSLWVDLDVPAGDPLWNEDVGRAAAWVADAWSSALRRLGIDAVPHAGGMVSSAWSRRVCFAGLAPGEVVVGGRKVVGVASRRTRTGARFQCVLHRLWDPAALVDLLALTRVERTEAVRDLAGVAAGIDQPFEAVEEALVEALPA